MTDHPTPGSAGEHELQERYNTARRAAAFYDNQMLDHLNEQMIEFIGRQAMAFIASSDAAGECDASFRAGQPGFIRVLDPRTVIYPEYRGNGVMATLGNVSENPHIGILFVDFFEATIGLHVNGKAKIVEQHVLEPLLPLLERLAGVPTLHDPDAGKKTAPERWVLVEVEEAYIHCSKHIPLLRRLDKDVDWGTDDNVRKGGDFFGAKNDERPWAVRDALKAAAAAADELDVAATVAAEALVAEQAPAIEVHVAPAVELELELEPLPVFEPRAPEQVVVEPAAEEPAAPAPVVPAPIPRPVRATSSSKLPFRMRRLLG